MNQQDALEILKTGRNVFLTGEPGTGKTHVLNLYITWLRKNHISNVAVTASTGIAATHICGRTVHAWFGITPQTVLDDKGLEKIVKKEKVIQRVSDTDVLIIDEISMLQPELLDAVSTICCAVKKNTQDAFGGIQVIFSGDFFQLPPVTKNQTDTRHAFEAESWKKANPVVCYLTDQYRQDDPLFIDLLRAVRGNRADRVHYQLLYSQRSIDMPNTEPVYLYSHNADIDYENDMTLDSIPGEPKEYTMLLEGDRFLSESMAKSCLSPKLLRLKKGAKVMFTKNNPYEGFMNGTLGTVVGFNKEDGLPLVEKSDGTVLKVMRAEWSIIEDEELVASITQIPLRLAWAITIHKSQGMSLEAAVIDLSRVFEDGQGYVALSRVRALKGIRIIGLNRYSLRVSDTIVRKDRQFLAFSERMDGLSGDSSRMKKVRDEQKRFLEQIRGNV